MLPNQQCRAFSAMASVIQTYTNNKYACLELRNLESSDERGNSQDVPGSTSVYSALLCSQSDPPRPVL